MALTTEQKNMVDEIIRAHLEELEGMRNFTLRTLGDYMGDIGFVVTAPSLRAALGRVVDTLEEVYNFHTYEWSSPKKYCIFKEVYKPTGEYVKDKNILTIKNKNLQQGDFTYDFATKTFSINIDEYKNTPRERNEYMYILANSPIMQNEWLFNYATTLDEIYRFYRAFSVEDLAKCPDGYIKFLQETDTPFDPESLERYTERQKYGAIGMNLIYESELSKRDVEWLISNDLLKSFIKTCVYNVKSGYMPGYYVIRDMLAYWQTACTVEGHIVPIDETKSLKVNKEMFQEISERKKNEALERQLKRLNFINGLMSGNLVVVVPQTQADKREEGKQQHNCVGYYYDESIIRGENLIYFIRKMDNPEKSYITCRYNIPNERTIEYRGFANNNVRDEEAIQFIRHIDELINANLE